MPVPAEGQAPDVAADMPQPEQAAVGSDTEAPMSTGHGHHAGARAPGSRLLGDDASTGAKELPAPERWINASIEDRSEEHTSELQSLMRNSYAVFCLKKKKNNIQHHSTHT